jgi:catechol 2,3-dioxygenase-like lactoylglutathione lyase family enzyme
MEIEMENLNMEKTRWHHVAISVRDMNRVLSFYQGVLGFEIEWDMDHLQAPFIDEITGLKDVDVRITMLTGYGTRLELFQYYRPPGETPSPRRLCDHGITHFCLLVEDVRELYDKLIEKNVAFISPPVNHRPDGWVCYMKDPEGVVIELLTRKDQM